MRACKRLELFRNDADYWGEKIAAFLHDPPDKILSIWGHEERAKRLQEVFHVSADNALVKRADQIASGLDRTFLPDREHGGYVSFEENPVITHPLGTKASFNLDLEEKGEVFSKVEELIQKDADFLSRGGSLNRTFYLFSSFHYLYHVLPERLAQEDIGGLSWRWLKLPADTRMPDHSIWRHCALTSALYSCFSTSLVKKASIMVFSITPVQDFISRSRKLRDYWTASLILSWLASEGMKAVILRYGSDHLIYPLPVRQPLIEGMLDKICGFCSLSPHSRDIFHAHAATLPNKFVFLVPAGEEEEAAGLIEGNIRRAWFALAEGVRDLVKSECFSDVPEECLKAFDKIFTRQIGRFWKFKWAAVPFVTEDDLKAGLAEFLPQVCVEDSLNFLESARKCHLPYTQTTQVYFYPLTYDLVQRALWAVKLSFRETLAEEPGIKCPLHPDLEVLRFSCVECAEKGKQKCFLTEGKPDPNPRPSEDPCWRLVRDKWHIKTDFKTNERLSAITLIKRLAYYVLKNLPEHPLHSYFKRKEVFPSSTEIAAYYWLKRAEDLISQRGLLRRDVAEILHRRDTSFGGVEKGEITQLKEDEYRKACEVVKIMEERGDPPEEIDRYYAIVLVDGDHMGRLLSGDLPTLWEDVLHLELLKRFREGKIDESFVSFWQKFLNKKRFLSPALHAAVSEALADFSLYTVPFIVQKHNGQLIYAGGDDVCAVFPVATALDATQEIACAYNWAFVRYGKPRARRRRHGKDVTPDVVTEPVTEGRFLERDERLLLHLGSGEGISISAGLLIVHHKWPLRAAIQRTHELLKLAKESGRAAMAIELQRRAGERRLFVAGWEDRVLGVGVWEAFNKLIYTQSHNKLSKSIFYRLAGVADGIRILGAKEPESVVSLIASQIKQKDEEIDELARLITVVLLGARRLKGDERNEERFVPVEALPIINFLAEAVRKKEICSG